MSGAARSIDHVGVVGPGLDAMAAMFERAGFVLTPTAAHEGGRTGNRCAMLDGGYIELVATLPGGASATLDRFLARHAGAHILALGVDDEAAAERGADGALRVNRESLMANLSLARAVVPAVSRLRLVRSWPAIVNGTASRETDKLAADLIKLAMLRVARRLESEGVDAAMVLQIHDELLLETPPASVATVKRLLVEEMAGAMELAVPLEVTVHEGGTWAECEK